MIRCIGSEHACAWFPNCHVALIKLCHCYYLQFITASEPHENSGDGMYALICSDKEEALALAASDPMHKAGVRSYTVRPWMQKMNSISY